MDATVNLGVGNSMRRHLHILLPWLPASEGTLRRGIWGQQEIFWGNADLCLLGESSIEV